MRLRIFGLAVLLVLCFGIVGAFAEEPKDQMFYVLEVICNPSTVNAYEKAHKAFMAETVKHQYPYPYTAYSTNDFHYYFITPMNNHGDVDNIFKAYYEFIGEMGSEGFKELMDGFTGTYEYEHSAVSTVVAGLSYMPENPRVKPEKANFIYWNHWYIKPGKEEEISSIWRAFKELYKKNNINDSWHMWVGGLGSDYPYHVGALFGKDQKDYFIHDQELLNGPVGDEIMDLWNKAMSLCRKFEIKMGMPRPDLSYAPKAE